MDSEEQKVDELLKARAALDDELRRYKATVTVMFTDVVGSTSYFERYGDTAGVAMLGRHSQAVTEGVTHHRGRVIKNIGDSVMAEFSDPLSATQAGVEIQRRLLQLNSTLPERERIQVRIGINYGSGFRHGNDLFGDVVNVAARITKHCGPAQILVSKSVHDALASQTELRFQSLGAQAFHGKEEKEQIFEMLWTDTQTYTALRENVNAAVEQGRLTYSSKPLDAMIQAAPPAQTPTEGQAPTLRTSESFPAALTSRYALLGEAGRGGMGVVYKAHDLETGEVVALKVLKPEIASEPVVLERFKNEVRLARKITHRNVCRTYEFGRADGVAYISMEYVDGESLRAVLSRFGGLRLAKTFAVAREICAGLEEAHQQGVIHRDLKPENVMLDRSGHVKLMDFGIARSVEVSRRTTGSIIGTPEYMAPEQAQGQPVTPQTDVYALGLILYECLAGAPAFSGDTPIAVALKQVQEPPPRLVANFPAIPPEVDEIIQRCLEKDPSRRFQSVAELDRALSQVPLAKPTPIPQKKSVLPSAAPQATKRSRWKVWVAAGIIPVVLEGGFLLAAWRAARMAISRQRSNQANLGLPQLSNSEEIPSPATPILPRIQPTRVSQPSVSKRLKRTAAAAPSQAASASSPAPAPSTTTAASSPAFGTASPKASSQSASPQTASPTLAALQTKIPSFAPTPQPANLSPGYGAPSRVFLVAGRYPRMAGVNFARKKLARLGVANVRIQPIRRPQYLVFVGPFVNKRQAQAIGAQVRHLGITQVHLIFQPGRPGTPPTWLVFAGQYPHPIGARLAAKHLWQNGVKRLHIRSLGMRVIGYNVLVGPFHNMQQANILESRLRHEGFPQISTTKVP